MGRSLFAEAADIVEERGWWQGHYFGPNGEVCLIGACLAAQTGARRSADLPADFRFGWVEDALEPLLGRWGRSAVWNDDPARTKDEVVALLRQAAQQEGADR